MEILYCDNDIVVCVKPARVLSTDEPGGVPDLVREELGDPHADVRTVHRLDRVVSGLMVLARNARAASELSRQIREDTFEKEYLAVVHGCGAWLSRIGKRQTLRSAAAGQGPEDDHGGGRNGQGGAARFLALSAAE